MGAVEGPVLLGQRLITCWVDRLQHAPCDSCSLHCLYSRCGCLLDASGRLCLPGCTLCQRTLCIEAAAAPAVCLRLCAAACSGGVAQ